jgi:hypothetical protein
VDDNDRLARSILEESRNILNSALPLRLKFKTESFILLENNEIYGLITAGVTPGNPYKINITRLIFKENMYDVGKYLVDFVIQKYGAKGAHSFSVTIDECHDELFNLFINGCGFRQCASETLWKIDKPCPQKSNLHWRYAQNSDAKKIAELYNSELINMYKPSLERHAQEYKEAFFSGMNKFYKNRYLIEEDSKIIGYFSITTSDNLNYVLDMTLCSGYDFDYEQVINVMLCEIAGKKRAFYPIVKQKNYVKKSNELEEYLQTKGYNRIQTQQILVKEYYKPIKEVSESWQGVTSIGVNVQTYSS